MIGMLFLAITLVAVAFLLLKFLRKDTEPAPDKKTVIADAKKGPKRDAAKAKAAKAAHPLVVCTCKGHTSDVLDFAFSWSGNKMITTADDRTLIMYSLDNLSAAPKFPIRINVEYDHGTLVAFGPAQSTEGGAAAAASTERSGNLVALLLSRAKSLQILSLETDKSTGKIKTVERKKSVHGHKGEVISLKWAKSGLFLLTCSNDTEIRVWSPECELLDVISTNSSVNYGIAISPTFPIFSAATFMPESKIWRFGNNRKVSKITAFTGKGSTGYRPHTKPVTQIDFAQKIAVTASLDGSWKVWEIATRNDEFLDPIVTQTHVLKNVRYHNIAVSADAKLVATFGSNGLAFYTAQGDLLTLVSPEDAGGVISMKWTPNAITRESGVSDALLGVCHDDGRVRLWAPPPRK